MRVAGRRSERTCNLFARTLTYTHTIETGMTMATNNMRYAWEDTHAHKKTNDLDFTRTQFI